MKLSRSYRSSPPWIITPVRATFDPSAIKLRRPSNKEPLIVFPDLISMGISCFPVSICFKDSPSQGVIGQIGRFADTEEIAQETCIEKIEFRTLDDSFGEIVKVRRQQMNDKSGLKNRNPVPCRGMGYAAIGGKG